MHNHWNCPTCVVIYCDQHQSAPALFRQPQQQPKEAFQFEQCSGPTKVEGLPIYLEVDNERSEEDLQITNVIGNYGVEEDDGLTEDAEELMNEWDASQQQQEYEQVDESSSKKGKFICSNSLCGNTYKTKAALRDHSRYHESMQCKEEPCRWAGPVKKFNTHLRKSHAIKSIKRITEARDRAGLKTRGQVARELAVLKTRGQVARDRAGVKTTRSQVSKDRAGLKTTRSQLPRDRAGLKMTRGQVAKDRAELKKSRDKVAFK